MSILNGEKTIVEDTKMFRNKFGVSKKEFCDALPDDERNAIVEMENDARRIEGLDLIDKPEEAPTMLVNDAVAEADTCDLIVAVLEDREIDYVHLYDGTVHTIVRVFDRNW
jgi:hypothetical protein